MFKSITNRLIINKFFPDKPKIDYELETKYNLFTNTIFIMHHGKKLLSFHPNLKYKTGNYIQMAHLISRVTVQICNVIGDYIEREWESYADPIDNTLDAWDYTEDQRFKAWKTRVNNNSDLKYIEIMHKRIFYTLALLRPQYDHTPEKWKKYNSLAKNYADQFQITEAD